MLPIDSPRKQVDRQQWFVFVRQLMEDVQRNGWRNARFYLLQQKFIELPYRATAETFIECQNDPACNLLERQHFKSQMGDKIVNVILGPMQGTILSRSFIE